MGTREFFGVTIGMNVCDLETAWLYTYNPSTMKVSKYHVDIYTNKFGRPWACDIHSGKRFTYIPNICNFYKKNIIILQEEEDEHALDLFMMHFMNREDELVKQHATAHKHVMHLMGYLHENEIISTRRKKNGKN